MSLWCDFECRGVRMRCGLQARGYVGMRCVLDFSAFVWKFEYVDKKDTLYDEMFGSVIEWKSTLCVHWPNIYVNYCGIGQGVNVTVTEIAMQQMQLDLQYERKWFLKLKNFFKKKVKQKP